MTLPNSPLEPKYELKGVKAQRELLTNPETEYWFNFYQLMNSRSVTKNMVGDRYNLMMQLFRMCGEGIPTTPNNVVEYVNKYLKKGQLLTNKDGVVHTLDGWCKTGCVERYACMDKNSNHSQSNVYVPSIKGMKKYWFGYVGNKTETTKVANETLREWWIG